MIFRFIFFLISLIPSNLIKIILFNLFPNVIIDKKSKIGFGLIFKGKKIKIINSKIGNFNFINCKNFTIIDSKIANNNFFYKINKFTAKNFSIIGSHNVISSYKEHNKIYIKMKNSQISSNFRLNLTKNLFLGNKVILGGMNTKIIEDANDNPFQSTIFLKNIFVGSNVVIKNGVRVNKNIIVGANTLIDVDILSSGKYFSKNVDIC